MKMNRYIYVVSENNELELPLLVTDSVSEAAKFIGCKTNSIHKHFFRHANRLGNSKYKIDRILEENNESI